MDRLEMLLKLFEQDSENSFLCFGIAKEYESRENPEKANEWYQLLVGKDPGYTGVYYHLAKNYMSTLKKDEALKTIEQGISICKTKNAQHDLAELNNLKMNILIGED
jgi:tetratricopeptide (TPR) repeat protein